MHLPSELNWASSGATTGACLLMPVSEHLGLIWKYRMELSSAMITNVPVCVSSPACCCFKCFTKVFKGEGLFELKACERMSPSQQASGEQDIAGRVCLDVRDGKLLCSVHYLLLPPPPLLLQTQLVDAAASFIVCLPPQLDFSGEAPIGTCSGMLL